jgi:hypothetical protein
MTTLSQLESQLKELPARPAGQIEPRNYTEVLQQRIRDLEGEVQRRGLNFDDFRRADTNCLCATCGKRYGQHPYGGPLTYDHTLILHRLCNGDLVKL